MQSRAGWKPQLEIRIPTPVDDVDATDDDAESPQGWQVVDDDAFEEMAAKIIVNPQRGIADLRTPLVRRRRDSWTLLHLFAGGVECQELLVFLMQAGVPPDSADRSGWTPLLEAAHEGQLSNCTALLAHGATPDLAVGQNVTPLHAAVRAGHADIAMWLLEHAATAYTSRWDNTLFKLLLDKAPAAARQYLDAFAVEQIATTGKKSRGGVGVVAVQYRELRFLYGEPDVPVDDTLLGLAVVSGERGKELLPHRAIKYLMRAKWRSFAKRMFRNEFIAYCLFVAAYYLPTIWADPDWVLFASGFDYWVACSRVASWLCALYLLLTVELYELKGQGVKTYLSSFWNWLNLVSYGAAIVTIPLEFVSTLAEIRNCVLALLTVAMWINMLQFLQVSTTSGLLLAMMARMVRDIYQFFILYAVFLLGFTGAFYILLRGSQGFESYINTFLSVFLMLYGNVNYDVINATTGWTKYMAEGLLMTYLMGAVTVLLNILIAMMATTYSDIWDAAEAETLLCHAQAILRMEKSLSSRQRHALYDDLLGRIPPPNKQVEQSDTFIPMLGHRSASAQLFLSRLEAKREMMAGIVEKMKAMSPSMAQAKQAMADKMKAVSPRMAHAKQAMEEALSASPTWAAVKPVVEAKAAHFRAQAANFSAPNLDALKESMYLKSAFDLDEVALAAIDNSGGQERELGLLEDGVRFEPSVVKRGKASRDDAVAELHAQVQQLTTVVKELKALGPARRRASLVRYASYPDNGTPQAL